MERSKEDSMKKMMLLIGMSFLWVQGCAKMQVVVAPLISPLIKPKKVIVCADRRIDQALSLHGKAKVELASHFDDHEPDRLYTAYYAAQDSMEKARSVRRCKDRQARHFYAMKNIVKLNRTLQRVVRKNMRDNDADDLIRIYQDQYYQVMPNDIK